VWGVRRPRSAAPSSPCRRLERRTGGTHIVCLLLGSERARTLVPGVTKRVPRRDGSYSPSFVDASRRHRVVSWGCGRPTIRAALRRREKRERLAASTRGGAASGQLRCPGVGDPTDLDLGHRHTWRPPSVGPRGTLNTAVAGIANLLELLSAVGEAERLLFFDFIAPQGPCSATSDRQTIRGEPFRCRHANVQGGTSAFGSGPLQPGPAGGTPSGMWHVCRCSVGSRYLANGHGLGRG